MITIVRPRGDNFGQNPAIYAFWRILTKWQKFCASPFLHNFLLPRRFVHPPVRVRNLNRNPVTTTSTIASAVGRMFPARLDWLLVVHCAICKIVSELYILYSSLSQWNMGLQMLRGFEPWCLISEECIPILNKWNDEWCWILTTWNI